jgi:hypothetical protein
VNYPALWAAFKAKYHKSYTSAQEKTRYAAYVARAQRASAKEVRRAARHAAKEKATGKKQVTSRKKKFSVDNGIFGDMTDAKFQSLNAGRPKKNAVHAKIKVYKPTARKPLKHTALKGKPTVVKSRFAQRGGKPLVPADIPKVSTVSRPRDVGANGPKPRAGGGESVANTGVDDKSMAADNYGEWTATRRKQPWIQDEREIVMLHDLRRLFPFGKDNGGTIVRNQGLCKSCWAQAAVEHAQAIIAVTYVQASMDATMRSVRLSAQQIIDCTRTADDTGCNGGTVAGQLPLRHAGIRMHTKFEQRI